MSLGQLQSALAVYELSSCTQTSDLRYCLSYETTKSKDIAVWQETHKSPIALEKGTEWKKKHARPDQKTVSKTDFGSEFTMDVRMLDSVL